MHIFHFSALLPFAFEHERNVCNFEHKYGRSSFHPLLLQPTSNSSNIQQLRSNQFCMLQKGAYKKHVLHLLCALWLSFYYGNLIFHETPWSRKSSSNESVSRVFLSLTFLCEFISITGVRRLFLTKEQTQYLHQFSLLA